MRKIWLVFIFLLLPFFISAADLPQPEGRVNDFAGIISTDYRAKLNALILELEEKTSAEIALVTVTSIAPYDEREYARLLFDNWKPGKKGKDNGVLVLLAIKERRWRIETGYGVEGILPDGLCGEIGRNDMVPYFKDARYSEGLYYGVARIAQVIAQEVKADIGAIRDIKFRRPAQGIGSPLFLYFFAFIFFTSLVARYRYWSKLPAAKRKGFFGSQNYGGTLSSGGWGSGGFGGGGFGGGGFGGGGGGGGGAGGGF